MRFYEQQEKRRRRTAILVLLFSAAVAGTVLGTYVSFALLLRGLGLLGEARSSPGWWWQPKLFLWTAGGTLGLILLGTLHMGRIVSLGGAAVAGRLGGRPVPPDPGDETERRLRNVVEEVAVASGSPVPEIFVLEREPGINAFAAGLRPEDAAVALTRGSVALLNRDELQGVVAHEMSHVRDGDIRLNARLTSLLHGVALVGQTGSELLRVAFGSTDVRGRRSPVLLALPGAVLAAVGSVGLFFARLAKGAVSRQREFLADASAVSLTRNPRGLAGALKRIGGLLEGSRLRARRAEEVSHMSFGEAVSAAFLGLGATHPPLKERILAIEPYFSGRFPAVAGLAAPEEAEEEWRPAPPPPSGSPTFRAAEFARPRAAPTLAQLAFARELLGSFPPEVATAARDAGGARALAFALLLDPQEAVRGLQVALLRKGAGEAALARTLDLAARLGPLGPQARLPLLDLALPALRRMSVREFEEFSSLADGLVRADGRVSPFELALGRVLERRLEGARRPTSRAVEFYALTPLLPDCRILLSAVALADGKDPTAAERAFSAGAARLTDASLSLASAAECGPDPLARSLDRIARSAPRIRERALDACAFAAAQDGLLASEEAEVLRILAAAIDLPLPPLVGA
ncbi:MAG TPA: M48 family metallopeptidase [Planctomycetota bacterium]|nr:M48 family metallopeptidase [Planctomycetota bacterium]